MKIDEDWRAGRRYMAKKGIRKLFDVKLEKKTNEINFILDEVLINVEANNSIYTT